MTGEDELGYLSATAALRMFRRRALSPVELMTAIVARSERLDPRFNTYTYTFCDRALAQSRKAERIYARKSGTPRPLEGIPVVIKDLHAVAGEITTYGSALFAENRDTSSHPGVARLLDAGAIMIARGTTPELGMAPACHSPLWGVTRNPWNPALSTGGSTGGGAAALAAGMATIADGSDYGGSIRAPAAFCGLFGFKPPHGRNPGPPPGNLDSFGAHGAITRTVKDGALVQSLLAGPHPLDAVSLRPRLTIPGRLNGIRGWKVAYSIDLGYFGVDEEVAANTRAAMEVFRDLGCTVREVEVGWTLDCLAAFEVHAAAGFYAAWGDRLRSRERELTDIVHMRATQSSKITAQDYFGTLAVQAAMYARMSGILEAHDIFVCPTNAVASIAADEPALAHGFVDVAGRRISAHNEISLTYPFNLLGQLPVASVPSGFSKCGVPTGIQIVGRSYDDVSVFRAAAAFERAQPWLASPASRPRLDG